MRYIWTDFAYFLVCGSAGSFCFVFSPLLPLCFTSFLQSCRWWSPDYFMPVSLYLAAELKSQLKSANKEPGPSLQSASLRSFAFLHSHSSLQPLVWVAISCKALLKVCVGRLWTNRDIWFPCKNLKLCLAHWVYLVSATIVMFSWFPFANSAWSFVWCLFFKIVGSYGWCYYILFLLAWPRPCWEPLSLTLFSEIINQNPFLMLYFGPLNLFDYHIILNFLPIVNVTVAIYYPEIKLDTCVPEQLHCICSICRHPSTPTDCVKTAGPCQTAGVARPTTSCSN